MDATGSVKTLRIYMICETTGLQAEQKKASNRFKISRGAIP